MAHAKLRAKIPPANEEMMHTPLSGLGSKYHNNMINVKNTYSYNMDINKSYIFYHLLYSSDTIETLMDVFFHTIHSPYLPIF